ncbi:MULTISPECIES: terpene synthase family protein [Chryseobacterium]|uniref:Terpene synthase n=1 Tax=Chryseobacterium geocarposphaerae TaxID=1416776 RepID=A0ABU1L9Y5_9FLAO|nr:MULTISPECIES: terpene synthase family protein [Chryseobacterium]MDR6403531.1 hypothetical protein [Chryseobacterium geocarposphaerae]MDR6697085.1 hypothetical protein [Chryseobacterium ginsenosidimutans]
MESEIKYFEQPYPLIFKYPWPDLVNPHFDQLKEDLEGWLDTDFTFLSPKTRETYKQMGLHGATARMLAIAPTYEHARACNRFMIWITTFDDYCGLCTVDELDQAHKRIIGILKGDMPDINAHPHDKIMAIIRDEYLAVTSPEWLEVFTYFMDRYMVYGMRAEAPYKTTGVFPPRAYFMIFREYSIAMYAYEPWAELGLGFVLPKHISAHPVIQRIQALTARIMSWQNDVYSVKKEIMRKGEVINLVLIIQHEQNISLDEAIQEVVRIHDADVAEFVALHASLPDFGDWHESVDKYVLYQGMMIQGLNSWYLKDTLRYHSNDQYAEKEYVRPRGDS